MPDLSVLIPARNERFLARTVADVLEHAQADTEIVVVLDGAWADPPLPQHPKLTVVYLPVSIGQRAATNLAARLSTARYVMKLDAHCAVAPGFDVELIRTAEELGEDVTQIPAQQNLHVYDWVCEACGARHDQAPHITACPQCGGALRMDIVWQTRRRTTSWTFTAEPKFGYDRAGQKRQTEDICDVMTSLGACFFLSRARYWQLGGCDESYGSWGSYGIEWACKSWLSGGRHVVNKRTYFAHWFRVGGIGFPYEITGGEQDAARQRARAIWFGNQWPGQVRPLSWLVEKFWPVAGWTDEQRAEVAAAGEAWAAARQAPAVHTRPSVGLVWYSDSQLDPAIATPCRRQLRRAAQGRPIAWVSLRGLPSLHPTGKAPAEKPKAAERPPQPQPAGCRIVLPLERGFLSMFKQILAGLEALDTDWVAFCEHDCLYPAQHFDELPLLPGVYAYNTFVYKVDATTGHALSYVCEQTSGLSGPRALLLDHYRRRVAHVEAHGFTRRMGFEPGKPVKHGGLDDVPRHPWRASVPLVDIRHSTNLTPSRWRREQFRDQRYTAGWTEADTVPGWGRTAGRMTDFLREITDGRHAHCQ